MDRHGGDVKHKVPVHFKSDLINTLEVDEPVAKAGQGEATTAAAAPAKPAAVDPYAAPKSSPLVVVSSPLRFQQ